MTKFATCTEAVAGKKLFMYRAAYKETVSNAVLIKLQLNILSACSTPGRDWRPITLPSHIGIG